MYIPLERYDIFVKCYKPSNTVFLQHREKVFALRVTLYSSYKTLTSKMV